MEAEQNTLLVIFQLDGVSYCIPADLVEAIELPCESIPLPDSPPYLLGLTKSALLPVVEMRTLLGITSLSEYLKQFSAMKQMHIKWVRELEEAYRAKQAFQGAVNPHLCKFGRWYDHYHTDNYSLKFVLKQLKKPHERIHLCGAQYNSCISREDWEGAAQRLADAQKICKTQMEPLLNKLIRTYQDVFRGIFLVVRFKGKKAALLVDEVKKLYILNAPPALTLPQGHINAVYSTPDGPLLSFDLAALFPL